MAAVFTKIGLGIGFFLLVMIFGIGFMVEMGNEYGVSMENQYQNKFNLQANYTGIANDAAKSAEGGGIDAQSTDIAQVQGATSAGRQQLTYFGLLKQGLNDIIGIIPYDAKFNAILFAIIGIMMVSGVIYLLLGRDG